MRESKDATLRLGVSSCLLGSEVRHDGGHRRSPFLTDVLGPLVEWVPVCPEVEVGMGIPRPTLRLVRANDETRMVETNSGVDHTRRMDRYTTRRVRALRSLELCGYVLKKNSPSCGMERVKLYAEKGGSRRTGTGLYAARLLEAYPNLPVEEEDRLDDARLRENFIERVFAYRRLRGLFAGRWTRGRVVAFHTAHELQIMAHSPTANRELGRLVASIERTPRANFRARYESGFMAALARPATPGRNANTPQQAADQLKRLLDPTSRAELSDRIHDYRAGLAPLVVPLTLLGHHARVHAVETLNGQTFLEPDPRELMLRNHV